MKRLRILFAPLGYFLSHFSRCMAVAEALKQRGHDIGFISVPKDEAWLTKQGYQIFPAYSMPPGDIQAYGAPFEYQKKYLGSDFAKIANRQFGIDKMAEDEFAIYARFKPDLLIWDGRPTAPVTASLMGIRAVGINNLSTPIDNQPACAASTEPEGRMTLELQIQNELKVSFAQAIEKSPHFLQFIRSIPWIVPGLPVLENKAKLALLGNPIHHYVGQLRWSEWDALPKPVVGRYQNKIVILLTLGSSFPFPIIVRHILRAFTDKKYQVIVNTGDQFVISAEGGNGHEVLPLICLRAYLEISHVVLHHGGHGTAMEVLRAGLPSVVIPFNGDQIDISKRLEQFGCALRIEKYPDEITADELAAALHTVLDSPSFKDNALRFKQELECWPDGSTMAADFIESHYVQMEKQTSQGASAGERRGAVPTVSMGRP